MAPPVLQVTWCPEVPTSLEEERYTPGRVVPVTTSMPLTVTLTLFAGHESVVVVPYGTVGNYDEEPPRVLQRLPTFWQLDLRIDRTWKKSYGSMLLFFDIQNITNHRNIEYRDSYLDENGVYRYEDVRGLPIIPYIGVEFTPR